MKKRMLPALLAALVLLSCLGGGTAIAATDTPPPAESWQPVELSGTTLHVVASMGEDAVRLLADAFEARTGCKLVYSCISTEEALDYLAGSNARADVYLGGSTDVHETLKVDGLLLYRDSPKKNNSYSWRYNDHDGFWEPLCLDLLSIGVNTELFESLFPGESPPTTLEELALPRYRGKLVMADPNGTYLGLTSPLSILRSHGRKEGERLLRAIGDNVAEYTATDLMAAQKVALGNYPLTVGAFSCQTRMQQQGLPLLPTVYPQAGWSIVPVSILKNSRDIKSAEAFVSFLLSRDGSELLCSLSYALPARENVTAPKGISHRLRDYPVSETFWSYRETSQRDYAQSLTESIMQDFFIRNDVS